MRVGGGGGGSFQYGPVGSGSGSKMWRKLKCPPKKSLRKSTKNGEGKRNMHTIMLRGNPIWVTRFHMEWLSIPIPQNSRGSPRADAKKFLPVRIFAARRKTPMPTVAERRGGVTGVVVSLTR